MPTLTQDIDLIIFDCDGVLVDSEIIAGRVLSRFLKEHGLELSPEACQDRFMGHSLTSVRNSLIADEGLNLGEDFAETIRALDKVAFETDLVAITGFPEILPRLGRPFCVASSGSMAKMQNTLGLTRLWDHFDPRIFSAQMVERAKPWPDLFLHAAREMGAEPSRCLVIEDSPTGVKAGVAAGMTVWGFTGGSHCGADHADKLLEAGAAQTFTDMRLLPDFL